MIVTILFSSCKNDTSTQSNKSIPNSDAIKMILESQELKSEIIKTKKHNNKAIELLGSFSISGVTLNGDNNNLLKMGFEGINVWVPINQQNNCVLLPNKEKFLDTDVQISDTNGKKYKMRKFPVFKATCTISYGEENKTIEITDPEIVKINERIKNTGGSNIGKELNYKVLITNIEWIGNRDYSR
ncbi:hypothetical protein [uncultured Polaribacter sp.]|uniref:hypothetical protein n=1 Tax=uncultured Polaribacter sp. TaxID=174711 RepID=UPI0026084632|nr:hypothetical protein [uncultured Polaribacter sp.]